MAEVTVDFIAKDPWRLVVVEEGPWTDTSSKLRRVQERLYGCIDVALQGQLASQYPESCGQAITIQLDGYALPREAVTEFFSAFSRGALLAPDYQEALSSGEFVSSVEFALNLQ